MESAKSTEDSGKTGVRKECPKCGFPLSKDDEFCPFCATPINPVSPKRDRKRTTYKTSKPPVPKGRMVFYFIVIMSLILFALLSN